MGPVRREVWALSTLAGPVIASASTMPCWSARPARAPSRAPCAWLTIGSMPSRIPIEQNSVIEVQAFASAAAESDSTPTRLTIRVSTTPINMVPTCVAIAGPARDESIRTSRRKGPMGAGDGRGHGATAPCLEITDQACSTSGD